MLESIPRNASYLLMAEPLNLRKDITAFYKIDHLLTGECIVCIVQICLHHHLKLKKE